MRYVPGANLPSRRLQHEVACPALQSRAVTLKPGASATRTFFGLYEPDHADASSDADLARIDAVQNARRDFAPTEVALAAPVRSLLQDAPPVVADPLSDDEIARRYPERRHEERRAGALLSFFTPDGRHNRHVVLRDKERLVPRRHGTLLRRGAAMLLDDATLCATCWMHGVFGAQLTIGNTSFHKLFSVSRDPYNITRASGLRILVDSGDGWRLLTVPPPSRWASAIAAGSTAATAARSRVQAIAAGDDPAHAVARSRSTGAPCRFLVFGHLVLGERELEHAGRIEIDATRKRFTFRPDPDWLWGQRYPDAVYHLVTSTPDAIEAIGGDELLYADGQPRAAAPMSRCARGRRTRFRVRGRRLDDRCRGGRALAAKYARGVDDAGHARAGRALLATT